MCKTLEVSDDNIDLFALHNENCTKLNSSQLSPEQLEEIEKVKGNIINTVETDILNVQDILDSNYIHNIAERQIIPFNIATQKYNDIESPISLFKINNFKFYIKDKIEEKLKNIYATIHNDASTIIFILDNKHNKTDFYIGIKNINIQFSEKLLEQTLKSNFPGIELTIVPTYRENFKRYSEKYVTVEEKMNNWFPKEFSHKHIGMVSAIPSIRKELENKKSEEQGIEKFLDTMNDNDYTAIFIATPLQNEYLNDIKKSFEDIYSNLSVYAKTSVAYNTSDTSSISQSIADGISTTVSKSISKSKSRGHSSNYGASSGSNSSCSYPSLFGCGQSNNRGNSRGTSSSYGTSSQYSVTKSSVDSNGETHTETTSTSNSHTIGQTVTINTTNKTIEEILKNIDLQLKRLKDGKNFGLWDTAAYFICNGITDNYSTVSMASNTFKALICGDETNIQNSYINISKYSEELSNYNNIEILKYLNSASHPIFKHQQTIFKTNGTHDFNDIEITPSMCITGNELPIFMGFPKKSVNGITVITSAEFGKNIKTTGFVKSGNRKIDLGNIIHMGNVLKNASANLTVNTLSSHVFVTGMSGSGKSNAIYQILEELINLKYQEDIDFDDDRKSYQNVNFLVIEPAKGEYKNYFGNLQDINIYTTNPKLFSMLKLNPFRFPNEIHVREHLDKLIEIFGTCWPLTAAMPAILKKAFEQSYEVCGWDLKHSIYILDGEKKYPTFKDILKILPIIINSSEYSSESKGDYKGALVTRVESLTNGIMGDVLCSDISIDDKKLFDENTIIDLSRVGSTETKSLLMGIIVMKLTEYRMSTATSSNYPLKHITVLEEAHNLLKRVSTEQSADSSNVQGKSVEMITDAIAEMRTYGEGFIIVDQTPSAVSKAAISNTSTKIILRMADFEDCQAIGKSIGLTDEQITELPKLNNGVAIVRQGNWVESVAVQIHKSSGIYSLKHNTINSMEERKYFKGQLIEKILSNYKRSINVDSIIKEANIPKEDKYFFKQLVNRFINLSISKRKDYLPTLVVKILECENIFNIIKPKDSPCYNFIGSLDFMLCEDKEKIDKYEHEAMILAEEWSNRLANSIKNYIISNNINLLCYYVIKYAYYNVSNNDINVLTVYYLKNNSNKGINFEK